MNYEHRLVDSLEKAGFVPLLKAIAALDLPQSWLAGGAVRNTVWRNLYPADCQLAIKDYDVMFYDDKGTRDQENSAQQCLQNQFPNFIFDVKNQYSFGRWRTGNVATSNAVEGISSWLHTATAVGVRWHNDEIEILSPFGLADLFNGVLRPTPIQKNNPDSLNKALNLQSKCKVLAIEDHLTF